MVPASAAAEMPTSGHGASPHIDADPTVLEPTSAAQLQAAQPDQPHARGTAEPEKTPADTAPAQAVPESSRANRRKSRIPGKPATARLEPAQLLGPVPQKPAVARTRRQTMAAASHAPESLARTSQADRMALGGSRLTSLAKDRPGKCVAAAQEAAPRARQTRRASVAPQLRAIESAKEEGGSMAAQLPASRPKRRRGASMATAPDQAAAAEAEPQPLAKAARRKTGVLRSAVSHEQDAVQISSAGAFPALCSLGTIEEDGEVEGQHHAGAGPSCTPLDDSAHDRTVAASPAEARAQQVLSNAAIQDKGESTGQRVAHAEQHDTAVRRRAADDRLLPESNSQQGLPSGKEQTCRGSHEQDEGPVRRSARRAILAARPSSAQGQPSGQRFVLPVMDQTAVPAGERGACTVCAVLSPTDECRHCYRLLEAILLVGMKTS